MKHIILLLFIGLTIHANAQDGKALLRKLNKKYYLVNDYRAEVMMKFLIPGVKIDAIQGKVLFKRPNKFKVKAKGIFFLPKLNPLQNISKILLDTNAYTAVVSGKENVNGKLCTMINLIPLTSTDDIILAKFWMDEQQVVIMKSQITTKNNGTIETISVFGSMIQYGLPDRMTITVDMNKINVPKMLAVDLNRKSTDKKDTDTKQKGVIELVMSQYRINQKVADAEFVGE